MLTRVACAVVALSLVACGSPPLEPRDPDPGVPHFKIETFNVEFQHWDDEATVEAVGHADADIVCLQEVTFDWEDVLRERYADEYPHMLFQPRKGTGGLAMLSRYELTDQGTHQAIDGTHPAWHVLADTPMGPVQLLNVHLRSIFAGGGSAVTAYLAVSTDHRAEIQDFSSYCLQGAPTLVMGDFNEEPDGAAVDFLESRGFRDILPLYHPGQPTWRYKAGWQFEQSLDHILYNDQFEPLNSYVVRKGNSDHIPVVAHVQAAPL